MAITLPLNDLANHIGAILGPGAPVTIDQEMVDHFAALTNDFQWVHVDTERSTREIGGTLVHGYFTLSLVPQFVADLLKISGVGHALNYGSDRLRYPAPLRSGTPVSATLRIIDLVQRGEGKMLRLETTIAPTDGGPAVCVAETLTLLFDGEGMLG